MKTPKYQFSASSEKSSLPRTTDYKQTSICFKTTDYKHTSICLKQTKKD